MTSLDPPADISLAPGRLSIRSLLIVVAFASVLLLPALGGNLRVLTQHEVFAAQPAREMLARGDWVLPHFAGVPRLVKPPTTGWMIAGSMWLFGTEAEWAVRLPTALAGVVTAALVAAFAARWLGDFAGLVAGLMQATFYYVLMQARLAEADMPMCAAVVLAMYAFARGAVDRDGVGPRGQFAVRWVLLFHLGAALAFLFKGVGIAFVFAGCIAWILTTRRWQAMKFLAHPLGLMLLVVWAGAWPLAAYRAYPPILDIWYRETLGRAGGAIADADPWHIYFWSVPLLLLPWLPFVVRGIIEQARKRMAPAPANVRVAAADAPSAGGGTSGPRPLAYETPPDSTPDPTFAERLLALRQHPRLMFLVCWFVPGMVILVISAARQKHYAIPMLPPLTLAAAAGFVGWLNGSRRPVSAGRAARLVISIVLAAGAIGAAAAFSKVPKARDGTAVTIGLVAVGVAATVAAYAAGRRRSVIAACFGTALAGGLAAQLLVLPAYDDYKASADLARRADATVPPGQPIYLAGLGEAHAAYYIRRPMVRIDRVTPKDGQTASDLDRVLAERPATPMYVLCTRLTVAKLDARGTTDVLDGTDHQRKTEPDRVVLVRFVPTASR